MPLASNVEWTGLEKLILDMQERIPRQASQSIAQMTADTGTEMLNAYQENLSGSVPSTAESPLPVGIRSGTLHDGAELHQINQYAFEIKNEVEYAGWIELGTEHMEARHPLQDAVNQVEDAMDVKLDAVAREIFESI